MIGHVQVLILEVEAVAHAAAVQPLVGKQALEILQYPVVVLLIQVLRRRLGVVVPELDRDAVGQEALHIVHQLRRRIVLVQHAVDTGGAGDFPQHLVRTLLHIVLQMAGDVHAGDLILVPLRKGQHLLKGGGGLGGEGGVDIDLVGGGDGVQHPLQGVQVGQRLAAGEHEIASGRDGVHHPDAVQNFVQREAGAVGIFFFVDAEGAVVLAVVGHKDRDSSAALPRFIGMGHVVDNLASKCTKTLYIRKGRKARKTCENRLFFS